jgi:hypothetical protein
MTSKIQRLTQLAAAAAVSVTLSLAAAPSVLADSANTTYSSDSVTAKVTVKAIDPATRHITVMSSSGELFTMKAPPEVRNFSNIMVGDTIEATYTLETEVVISPPNTPLPPDTESTIAARAAKGSMPAAVVANHAVVTGAVLAIDMTHHTLKIVSPQGGAVHIITVRRADRQAAMAHLKVGDTITAYITESLLMAVRPG